MREGASQTPDPTHDKRDRKFVVVVHMTILRVINARVTNYAKSLRDSMVFRSARLLRLIEFDV
jgi:hypothetical protein